MNPRIISQLHVPTKKRNTSSAVAVGRLTRMTPKWGMKTKKARLIPSRIHLEISIPQVESIAIPYMTQIFELILFREHQRTWFVSKHSSVHKTSTFLHCFRRFFISLVSLIEFLQPDWRRLKLGPCSKASRKLKILIGTWVTLDPFFPCGKNGGKLSFPSVKTRQLRSKFGAWSI